MAGLSSYSKGKVCQRRRRRDSRQGDASDQSRRKTTAI